MTIIQVVVLALVQGLTEFLPISSSAHLILGSKLLDWPDQGLMFDVATHLGTLIAVLVYFRADLARMAYAMLDRRRGDEASRKMGVLLVVASVPVIVAGGLLHGWVETALRDIRVIAASTIAFGLLLWWADTRFTRIREMRDLDMKSGIMIGMAQILSLVPGTSRSGITITAGRMLGFNADTAARFSFLLSIPVIAAAGAYGVYRMLEQNAHMDWLQFSLAVAIAAVAGWLCIAAFLALVLRIGLLPFVVYRLALGAVLVWMVYYAPY